MVTQLATGQVQLTQTEFKELQAKGELPKNIIVVPDTFVTPDAPRKTVTTGFTEEGKAITKEIVAAPRLTESQFKRMKAAGTLPEDFIVDVTTAGFVPTVERVGGFVVESPTLGKQTFATRAEAERAAAQAAFAQAQITQQEAEVIELKQTRVASRFELAAIRQRELMTGVSGIPEISGFPLVGVQPTIPAEPLPAGFPTLEEQAQMQKEMFERVSPFADVGVQIKRDITEIQEAPKGSLFLTQTGESITKTQALSLKRKELEEVKAQIFTIPQTIKISEFRRIEPVSVSLEAPQLDPQQQFIAKSLSGLITGIAPPEIVGVVAGTEVFIKRELLGLAQVGEILGFRREGTFLDILQEEFKPVTAQVRELPKEVRPVAIATTFGLEAGAIILAGITTVQLGVRAVKFAPKIPKLIKKVPEAISTEIFKFRVSAGEFAEFVSKKVATAKLRLPSFDLAIGKKGTVVFTTVAKKPKVEKIFSEVATKQLFVQFKGEEPIKVTTVAQAQQLIGERTIRVRKKIDLGFGAKLVSEQPVSGIEVSKGLLTQQQLKARVLTSEQQLRSMQIQFVAQLTKVKPIQIQKLSLVQVVSQIQMTKQKQLGALALVGIVGQREAIKQAQRKDLLQLQAVVKKQKEVQIVSLLPLSKVFQKEKLVQGQIQFQKQLIGLKQLQKVSPVITQMQRVRQLQKVSPLQLLGEVSAVKQLDKLIQTQKQQKAIKIFKDIGTIKIEKLKLKPLRLPTKLKEKKREKVGIPELPKEKKRKRREEGYHVFVKNDATKRARFIRATDKPRTRTQALGKGAQVADNSISQEFIIKKTKAKAISKPQLDRTWNRLRGKFRGRIVKGREIPPKKRFIERRRNAIDTMGEKQKLSAARFLARVRGKKPKKRRRKR